MLTKRTLELADAEFLIQAAADAAETLGVPQNIAVTDNTGHLIAFHRMDGASLVSIIISINKAFTAASARAQTADIAPKTFPGEPGFGLQNQHSGRFTTLGGGVPVLSGNEVVGAIGVSGGSIAQDIQVAVSAVTRFCAEVANS